MERLHDSKIVHRDDEHEQGSFALRVASNG
jgi:hypothetical protein